MKFAYLGKLRDLPQRLSDFRVIIWHMLTFVLLLVLYVGARMLYKFFHHRLVPKFLTIKLQPFCSFLYNRACTFLSLQKEGTISRIDLIELSIRNMRAKKTRTLVTIGGMAIGVGAIVFLVSIGYGLQELVITRVARLDEMKQADISPPVGGKVKITDKTIADFKDIPQMEMALPQIAVVGRINYQNSVSDMAVYGVTADYLRQSAIQPVVGKIFDSNAVSQVAPSQSGEVAGTTDDRKIGQFGEKIRSVDFSINPAAWVRVRERPTTVSRVLGYTKRVEGRLSGDEIWGQGYIADDNSGSLGVTEEGEKLGVWVKSPILLWQKTACDPTVQGDCENGEYLVSRDEQGRQKQQIGYIARINLKVEGVNISPTDVLGVTTESSSGGQLAADPNQDWVEIASESGVIKPPEVKTVNLSTTAKKQAVVNRAFLKILGVKENEAVGKKFKVSFVVVGNLLADTKEKIESNPEEYTIVGVTPEDKTPLFYVPFTDLRSLGIVNYSQIKVVAKDKSSLGKIRKQVENLGFVSSSVVDTVESINSLFSTAKLILGLLGMVALAVAALGMFNTLTVSLLERTREVGLMKAMGMKSSEVQELFLTESMVMGFFGGILGIILGWASGKLVGLFLSAFAIFKGVGFVDISHVPLFFVLVVIFLSFLVGLVTGIYPAKRATRISALNALRYE